MRKVEAYLKGIDEFLEDWEEALETDKLRQAGEKLWGAASQAVKALAELRGWQHDGHAPLFEVIRRVAKEYNDEQLRYQFGLANVLHINFYENWLEREDITSYALQIKEFIGKIRGIIDEERETSG